MRRAWFVMAVMLCTQILCCPPQRCMAQEPSAAIPADNAGRSGGDPQPTATVDVQPLARDPQIASRLQSILTATEWFESPQVEVREGVVFLSGSTSAEQHKTWAGDLARRTQDVAAVVNKIQIRRSSLWDIGPAQLELESLWHNMILAIPNVLLSLTVMGIAWWIGRHVTRISRVVTARRLSAPLLREVLSRMIGILVFLLGVYLVLRISGLTRLAVTVLGGTGLVGLVIGIAFRDITENFLASIFLSMQRPFQSGDLIEINGLLGYVQRLTTRTTILMTLDGNHVQIPNSTVYKSPIRNFTSNPNRRETFTVGIGYDDAIPKAQEIALTVLQEHPAIMKNPEPWVLVDSLGSSTVVLKIYFWLNGTEHSWLKVRSSAIRLIKRAFQDSGISMPDEAREVVFPRGVQVEVNRVRGDSYQFKPGHRPSPAEASEDTSSVAEGGLTAEAETIEGQAQLSRMPEEGNDLLKQ